MRNVFLSVVVICALLVAGIGGTLASFSDTEASMENVLEIGNLDLKVNGHDDDGIFLDGLIQGFEMWPCDSEDFTVSIHNLSDNSEDAFAYIGFKNFNCYEVYTTKFPESDRPEPEDVAENGGMLANQVITGMGPFGQNCTLPKFIEVWVGYETGEATGVFVDVIGTQSWGAAGTVYLSELWDGVTDEILWVYLGGLDGCNTRVVKVSMHISNWSEEEWNARASMVSEDLPPATAVFPQNGTGDAFYPFNDWLTNLFMNDGVEFETIFGLTSELIGSDFAMYPD